MASTGFVLYIKPRSVFVEAAKRVSGFSISLSPRFSTGVIQSGITASSDQTNLKAWLPPARQPIGIDANGVSVLCDPRWYRFFQWFTEKMGGADGPSILDISTTVQVAQSQSASASLTVNGLTQQAVTNAEALSATIQVVQNNSIPGATQIPPVMLNPVVTGDGGSGGEGGF